MRTMDVTLRPYDSDVAEDVFSILFYANEYSREDGLFEIPAASYQLVLSARELIQWECKGADREAIKNARGVVAWLRDVQKGREYSRKEN